MPSVNQGRILTHLNSRGMSREEFASGDIRDRDQTASTELAPCQDLRVGRDGAPTEAQSDLENPGGGADDAGEQSLVDLAV